MKRRSTSLHVIRNAIAAVDDAAFRRGEHIDTIRLRQHVLASQACRGTRSARRLAAKLKRKELVHA